MQDREKKLLLIAGSLFILYILPAVLYPTLKSWVVSYQQSLDQDKNKIIKLQRLQANAAEWKIEHTDALRLKEEIENGLLIGSTRELIGGQLHNILSALASLTKIKVKSLDLTEFAETGEWLLVTKSMKFESSSQSLINFIRSIQSDPAQLHVVSLDLRVLRTNHLTGELKVTGFSHLIADEKSDNAAENN
jgi:hypothetical protein